MPDYYSGTSEAQIRGNRERFTVGTHTVEITEMKQHESESTPGDVYFIVATKKRASTDPNLTDEPSTAMKLGGKFHKATLGDIMSIIASCVGLTPGKDDAKIKAQITGDVIRAVLATNALKGAIVTVIGSKKANSEYVRLQWAPHTPVALPGFAASAPAFAPPPAHAHASALPPLTPPPFVPPPPPPQAPVNTQAGYLPHPHAPGWYYRGTETPISAAQYAALPPF